MDVPIIEQAKIQAQVLIPLVKALQGVGQVASKRSCPKGARCYLPSLR
jgi:hypothetical protein